MYLDSFNLLLKTTYFIFQDLFDLLSRQSIPNDQRGEGSSFHVDKGIALDKMPLDILVKAHSLLRSKKLVTSTTLELK